MPWTVSLSHSTTIPRSATASYKIFNDSFRPYLLPHIYQPHIDLDSFNVQLSSLFAQDNYGAKTPLDVTSSLYSPPTAFASFTAYTTNSDTKVSIPLDVLSLTASGGHL
jgi:hypothetical protein